MLQKIKKMMKGICSSERMSFGDGFREMWITGFLTCELSAM